jgi:hypothetical protein
VAAGNAKFLWSACPDHPVADIQAIVFAEFIRDSGGGQGGAIRLQGGDCAPVGQIAQQAATGLAAPILEIEELAETLATEQFHGIPRLIPGETPGF